MNLAKLFEMQETLDGHILNRFPELRFEDLLPKKILALQVELGELAQEWRGFKFWSEDQESRTNVPKYPTMNYEDIDWKNPLLEEYVDCLHFILSIGLEFENYPLEMNYEVLGFNKNAWNCENTVEQFRVVFKEIVEFSSTHDELEYIELVSQFLGLGEMLGFTWEQIEQAYIEKNNINHQRQETGY